MRSPWLRRPVAEPDVAEGSDHVNAEWIRAGKEILAAGDLSKAEWGFVTDLVDRLRWSGFEPSEKQMRWFADIYRKKVKVGEFRRW